MAANPIQPPCGKRDGAAIIEMVAGLVVLLLLLVGLLQIGQLGLAHTRTMMTARERADERAMAPSYHRPGTPPLYIQEWQPGPDGVRYTQHDRPVAGPHSEIHRSVLAHARPDAVARYTGSGPLQELESSSRISDAFYFVRGESRSERVPILPILRRLAVRDEWIEMEHTVWMPWTGGLNE